MLIDLIIYISALIELINKGSFSYSNITDNGLD